MVKEIVHINNGGTDILTIPAGKTTYEEGRKIAEDLIDTANYNNEHNDKKCCGLSASQIGESKKVCIIMMPDRRWLPVINPKVVGTSSTTHMSSEGCMSVDKITKVRRYDSVTVLYQSGNKKYVKATFVGFMADEIQHEMDHMKGILI